ncbi:hypothetical protein N431DRAFT_453686 [Stipitochalara longipes BDJ]|nr:hypothetical protein N431DRAFT_453686 [Stipitochalara longipes BDJ]
MASVNETYSNATRSQTSSSARCFCCLKLGPLTNPRGVHDEMIVEFALRMTLLVIDPPPNAIPLATLHALLEDSEFLIKYQKYLHSETLETRYFLPHPTEPKFIEIEEGLVKGGQEKWRDSMRYLKLQCDVHQGPLYICRIVQRDQGSDGAMTRGLPAVHKIDLEDKLFEHHVQE